MRIAFYAPLKPPDHPVPSGDRRVARLLMAALAAAGHEVVLAARLRSRDGAGDARRQARLAGLGERLARRYLARVARDPLMRPDLWFTYHLYHKAPDWLGPGISAALGIPYVVAEASLAGKQRRGPWAPGHAAAAAALGQAAAVVGLNSADREGVLPALADPARWFALRPFLDSAPFAAAAASREAARASLARRHGLDPARPWLIAVAMMREGDKLASYRLLGHALAALQDRPWQLLVVGDGATRPAVEAALAPAAGRAAWLGALPEAALPGTLAAADLCAWPAINEAFGMALLEAQAAGLPVVAGRVGGVPDIVADGLTGLLVPPGDAAALAAALARLLDDDALRRAFAAAAAQRVRAEHDIAAAARRLGGLIDGLARAAAA